jgi:uncharacterized protein YwgA
VIDREDIVAALISSAPNGRLTSRVRFQKTVYLLQELGFKSGFDFEYHHYGPYSRELDNAIADARTFDLIEERIEHRKRDGASYSAFASKYEGKAEAFSGLGREKVGKLIDLFVNTNVTVLELAATIDWLWRVERFSDWRSEIKVRKGQKTESGRLEKAVELLRNLALVPPEPAGFSAL